MRNLYAILGFLLSITVSAQNVNIPDANFKAILLQSATNNTICQTVMGVNMKLDSNNDGEVQVSEAALVGRININPFPVINPLSNSVTSIVGIKEFTNLQYISIQKLPNLISADVSDMPSLLGISFQRNAGLSQLNFQNSNNFTFLAVDDTNISSIDLSGYDNVQTLWAGRANLSTVNLSGCTALHDVSIFQNHITTIDLSTNINLKTLNIRTNNLSTLNVSNLIHLEDIEASANSLTSINLQNTPALKKLIAGTNQLTSIDFSQSPALEEISLPTNQISAISLSNLPQLQKLNLGYNQLTSLDLSHNPLLNSDVFIWYNHLTYLNVKNGAAIDHTFHFANNPQISYICADPGDFPHLSQSLSLYTYVNCQVNSYCTFTPGGNYYTVQGNEKLDIDSNGYNTTDPNVKFPKFNIASSAASGSIIGNQVGNYSIFVDAGSHTITPVLENPNYFSISPTAINVTFPGSSSPLTQNFCMQPNGVHNDLEVMLIPITNAVPGFNSHYKLIYKNKGTGIQSGTVSLNFDDNISDYLISTATPTSQTFGVLSWNFSNLQPFETREVYITIKMNTPTATPPLQGGYILHNTAQITGLSDETPTDNTFTLNQTVVNSFDPNDKTCLEGAIITQSQVGDYVHYLIRFENTGTANAQNIVVKDLIDTTKFDVASLVPMDASHSFVTKVSNPGTVEFIFENIQLPFNDANNDGYISFKIKTKSSLTTGDSFTNTASIYFDYNAPIITNTYTTTVSELLSTSEVKQDLQMKVFPNPTSDYLNFKTNEKLMRAEIFDASGRLVAVVPILENRIDLRNLESSQYTVRVSSKANYYTIKVIKK